MKRRYWATVAIVALMLTACGSDDADTTVQRTGVLLDAPVEGVRFRSMNGPELIGLTNASGQFPYFRGNETEFSIGGIILGTSPGLPIVTMLELAQSSRPAAINLTRFLMTLDEDLNPTNGIRVPGAVFNQAQFEELPAAGFSDLNFEQSQLAEFARGVYAALGGSRRDLVSSAIASATLDCARADAADGSVDNDCGGNPPAPTPSPIASPTPGVSSTPGPSSTPSPTPNPSGGGGGGGGTIPPPPSSTPTPSATPSVTPSVTPSATPPATGGSGGSGSGGTGG